MLGHVIVGVMSISTDVEAIAICKKVSDALISVALGYLSYQPETTGDLEGSGDYQGHAKNFHFPRVRG